MTEAILFPVPHRHLTFTIPKMLRPYFRFDRDLLKDFCRIAQQCLREFLRTTLDLPDGLPGVVMTIHSFGDYLDFHPHLHALVADGLFARSGLFYVLPERPGSNDRTTGERPGSNDRGQRPERPVNDRGQSYIHVIGDRETGSRETGRPGQEQPTRLRSSRCVAV